MKKTKIIFIFAALCNVFSLLADPALPDSVLVHQPDGTDLWVYDRGDEYYNWVESTDGYVIVKNKYGIFEYATITDSLIQPSGTKVYNRQDKRLTESSYVKSQKGKVQEEMKKRSIDARKNLTGYRTAGIPSSPVVGVRKVLTILMGFSDKPFTYSSINFDSLMNSPNYLGFMQGGSVRDYYYENSYGQLSIESTVIGPFLASNPSSYYSRPQGHTDDHSADLVVEAINQADSYGIDFSLFDGNNDGYVDCVHVIFAGNRYSVSGDGIIWPYNSAFITPILKDGKNIAEFIMTPELFDNAGTNINSIGTICHELGHVFGAPDFYPIGVSHNAQDSLGTGIWDVMANGSHLNGGYSPTHHNPYTKTAIFQWTNPVTIDSTETNTTYSIPASSTNANAIYKIPTKTEGEYYLLENKQKISFDRYLPDSGLLIYHIHSDIENAIANNTVNSHLQQKCYLVNPAATLALPDTTNIESYGAPALNIFPANQYDPTNIFFTSQTNPRSQSWAGEPTGVDVCFIQHDGNNIKFVVNPQIDGPCNLTDSAWFYMHNIPNSVNITWSVSNPNTLLYPFVIDGANNKDSVKIKKDILTLNNDTITRFVTPKCSKIFVTISTNEKSYYIQTCMNDPEHPVPAISVSGFQPLSPWYSGVAHTFTITNCPFVPDSLLSWSVIETFYDRSGRMQRKHTRYTGHSISYTPFTYFNTIGSVNIKVTDNALDCPDNTTTLGYTTTGPSNNISISEDTKVTPFNTQHLLNENNRFTYELWHSIYGLMHNADEQINTTDLPQGIYILLLKDKNGDIVEQKKIMIR